MAGQRPLVIGTEVGRILIPAESLQWQFARSSGPGGQHVNRTSSKAVLRFRPAACPALPEAVRQRLLAREQSRLTTDGELVIASQRHREQGRNVADCRAKLSGMIERAAVPPKPRRATRVPRSSRAARLDTKRRRAATKRLRQPPKE